MTMKTRKYRSLIGLLAIALISGAAPVLAQQVPSASMEAEARVKKLEAEVKALQRQVFPGGSGKYFAPEIDKAAAPVAAPSGPPATTPLTDLLGRVDSLEAHLTRLTAQGEENGNRIAQLEAKLAALSPPPPAPAPSASPAPSAGDPAAASAAPTDTPAPAVAPAPAPVAQPIAAPAAEKPRPAPTAKPAAPSAKRVAAVKAIEKPATKDPGDDEYNYGFRLWEAKFYPEAEQQMQLFITKYPKHARISYGRNLLGRAFLDDNKPHDAAQWFLTNYKADPKGARAADSLLYLGEAMRVLNDTKRACVALGEFANTYPTEASGRLKAAYDKTRSGVKCN
jgi:TolA-binding protein